MYASHSAFAKKSVSFNLVRILLFEILFSYISLNTYFKAVFLWVSSKTLFKLLFLYVTVILKKSLFTKHCITRKNEHTDFDLSASKIDFPALVWNKS